jgi:hypothetical protein
MAHSRVPLLPPPPPLRGADPDSFANVTVVRRLPAIARRVLAENELAPGAAQAVAALVDDLPHGTVRQLRDPGAPDSASWEAFCGPYLGQSWLDVPFFFAECYFYRRILEATGYFQPGPGALADPFALQKRLGLDLAAPPPFEPRSLHEAIAESLWGNQADLSLWPAGEGDGPGGAHLLADDAVAAVAHLQGLAERRASVGLVLDNAGAELVHDLGLADALLAQGMSLTLHAKAHPIFVSDAMEADVLATIDWLAGRPDGAALGWRLREALEDGRLAVRSDWYWTSPLAGWELPAPLRDELAGHGLLISKGDANYRRWLGDRPWPLATPLDQILAYSPAPLLLLRTSKSEAVAGLDPARVEEAAAQDASWRTSGRWGLIQLCG